MGMRIHGHSDAFASLTVAHGRAALSFASPLSAACHPFYERRVLRERRASPHSSFVPELAVRETTPPDQHASCAVLSTTAPHAALRVPTMSSRG